MSCFSKISAYMNFISKIINNNLLNCCDKCFIICFLNSCFMCSIVNDTNTKSHKKNSEDFDSHIIEIDKFNNV